MNKKIKIIDVFLKISKGEEIPERILFKGIEFIWKNNHYISKDNKINLTIDIMNDINLEVEILEDNTEDIEELDKIHTSLFNKLPEDVKINYLRGFIQEDRDIINKLVKAINAIRKEKE